MDVKRTMNSLRKVANIREPIKSSHGETLYTSPAARRSFSIIAEPCTENFIKAGLRPDEYGGVLICLLLDDARTYPQQEAPYVAWLTTAPRLAENAAEEQNAIPFRFREPRLAWAFISASSPCGGLGSHD